MKEIVMRRVLFHLNHQWDQDNHTLFQDQMRKPQFILKSKVSVYGEWDPKTRRISLQLEFIESYPWLEVIEILRHEMAHQYVHEVLKVFEESPHGPTFQKVCAERGIDSRGSGAPTLNDEAQRLINRVNKLLALSESENPYEAELATTQAHTLLLKHHLKLEEHGAVGELTGDLLLNTQMSFKQLGTPKTRHYQYEYAITQILMDHFFVDCIWLSAFDVQTQKIGNVAEICGRIEDLEVAEYVYHFLYNHLKIAWNTYKKEAQVSGLTQRLSFSLGVVQGFSTQLKDRRQTQEERGLILVGNRQATQYLKRRHPKFTKRGGGDWRPSNDYAVGFSRGQSLRLRQGISLKEETQASTSSPKKIDYQH